MGAFVRMSVLYQAVWKYSKIKSAVSKSPAKHAFTINNLR